MSLSSGKASGKMAEHNHPPGEGCPACLETAREGFADATNRIAELEAELEPFRGKVSGKTCVECNDNIGLGSLLRAHALRLHARAEKAEAEVERLNVTLDDLRNPEFKWIHAEYCDHDKHICRNWPETGDVREACNRISWFEELARRAAARKERDG